MVKRNISITTPTRNWIILEWGIQTGSEAHPASYQMDTGALSPGYIYWDMNLSMHLHVVPRLRMHGAIPPLHHVFMVW
jgi:hypothetical protein